MRFDQHSRRERMIIVGEPSHALDAVQRLVAGIAFDRIYARTGNHAVREALDGVLMVVIGPGILDVSAEDFIEFVRYGRQRDDAPFCVVEEGADGHYSVTLMHEVGYVQRLEGGIDERCLRVAIERLFLAHKRRACATGDFVVAAQMVPERLDAWRWFQATA